MERQAPITRAEFVMSLSTTQRAVLNGLGRVAVFASADAQETYRRELQQRLDACEPDNKQEQTS